MAKSALLLRMIDVIRQNPGVTVPELASTLGRSERTVYRWLSELAVDLQSPAYCVEGGYFLSDKPAPKPVHLTPEELLALRMSLRSAPFGDGSPIKAYAESAWQKLRQASSDEDLIESRNIAANHGVNVTVPEADIRSNIIETLENGVRCRVRLRVLYRSQNSGKTSEYTIDPYGIAFRRHSWYLVAYSHTHGKVIQMKLIRFLSAQETGVTFEPPQDFCLDDFFRFSWEAWAGGEPTKVVVRFSSKVAPMICECKRHPSQVLHRKADGSVVFEVVVAGTEEIGAWIMGYGKEAEVLEPEALRDYIVEHLKASMQKYGLSQQKKLESAFRADRI